MIFAKSYYWHKQFQFDLMTKRNLKWQIIKVCSCYRNFFWTCCQKSWRNLQGQKDENIRNDKRLKIFEITKVRKTFAMTKNWKYLQWHKLENICDDKKLKIFAMTKVWKYLQWQKLKIFAMTKVWKYLQWQKVENIWWSDRRGSARSLDWRAAPAWNFLITIQLLLVCLQKVKD